MGMRRSLFAALSCALVAAACGQVGTAQQDRGSDNRELSLIVTEDDSQHAVVEPAGTAPAPSITQPRTHPLTTRSIAPTELLLMMPTEDDLGDLAAEFILDDGHLEANSEVVRTSLQDRTDEAVDIELFGRLNGARSVFRPRALLFGDSDLSSIHASVALFHSEAGASGYLADFALDAAKGIGAAAPTRLEVLDQHPFAVDVVGDETVAFTLDHGSPGEGTTLESETVIAFRVGRVLAVTSVTHEPEGDFRVRAIELTQTLEQRVLGVLRGTIREVEPIPEVVQEPLVSYAFHFAQVIDSRGAAAKATASGVVAG